MIGRLDGFAVRGLRRLDPERAHRLAIETLKLASLLPVREDAPDERLKVNAFGLEFPHPLGLAAGFDKSFEAIGGLARLGFAFLEAGTVTPRPQVGNPKPRLFRLDEDAAVINRMGFNNDGFELAARRLASAERRAIVGANFGPNKDAEDRAAAYIEGVKIFAPHADYLTINISSPNTAGLRDLQKRDALDDLIARVAEARELARVRRPLLIKIAPDLDLRELDDICAVAIGRGVDGLIISNTTLARPPGLRSAQAAQSGGLSGRPLFEASTRMLARARLRCEGAIKLIGCGGVEDATSALAKIEAGADLVQIYTGFLFRGPAVIGEIRRGLLGALAARGVGAISQLVGTRASEFAPRRDAE